MGGSLGNLDWVVVGAYFALIFGVALVTGRHRGERDGGDFFLAGRNVGWFVVGASIFASNIGSEHLVGLAGSAAKGGIAVAQFEILAGLVLLLLGWLFVPFYLSSGVFTMPEFLERRYSAGPRAYLAWLSVVGYVLTKIAVTVAAGGIVFETLMGLNFWTGALLVIVVTGVYTAWGGLRVVLYTDMAQMFILLGGALGVTWIGLDAVGGWAGLREAVLPETPEALSLWRPADDPDYPWTGILFGAPILAVWYWCTDQFIVQRVLSAHNVKEARRGTIFAAYLKQLPLFLFVLPGVIALAMVNTGRLELAENDAALPSLVMALLPDGLRGIVAAGLLAALMSSLSSTFNSCSTIFTIDIYRRFDPGASDVKLVRVGQFATLGMIALALAWIPFMDLVSGQLFTYVQSIQAYISPPIAAVFLVGILWRGANATGAKWALGVGSLLGLARLLLEINAEYLGGPLLVFAKMNFLHAAIALFVISVATLIIASRLRPGELSPTATALTLAGQRPAAEAERRGRKPDLVLSIGVILLILALWVIFS